VEPLPSQLSDPEIGSLRPILAVALGNGLEMYDFTIYSFFSAFIAPQFFPSDNPLTSLLLAVAAFGGGFLLRPVGAIVIGGYADRVGRRSAMTVTIWLMALGTALIAICPAYAVIGVAAPLLLVFARMVQGFSAGGEVGAAMAFLGETGAPRRRGLTLSWQLASQGAAVLAGSGSGLLMTMLLSEDELARWGWRLPFLLGLLIAPVGYYIRKRLPERHPMTATAPNAIKVVVRSHWQTMLLAIAVVMGSTVTSYVMVYFMPTFLIRMTNLPASTSFAVTFCSAILILLLAPVTGAWTDRLGSRKPLALSTYLLTAISILPVFWRITTTTEPMAIMLAIGWIVILMTIGTSAALILLLDLFPVPVRATAFGTVYAIGAAVFGGSAQFVVTWLIATTGTPLSAGVYVTVCVLLGALALIFLKEPAGTSNAAMTLSAP
jgi:MHS family proline/betaine transporter-like MFS transporter